MADARVQVSAVTGNFTTGLGCVNITSLAFEWKKYFLSWNYVHIHALSGRGYSWGVIDKKSSFV